LAARQGQDASLIQTGRTGEFFADVYDVLDEPTSEFNRSDKMDTNLKEYFDSARGLGILATANDAGEVDAAIYARPHMVDDDTVAFIMADRLSHANVTSNPNAAYLFREDGEGYRGVRLHLMKLHETDDPDAVDAIRRKPLPAECNVDEGSRFLVHFRVSRVRPLVGG
jgi:hypothetical protein